jgi:hypothetical protein
MLGGNDTLGDTAWIAYQAKVPPISSKHGMAAAADDPAEVSVGGGVSRIFVGSVCSSLPDITKGCALRDDFR